MEVSPDSLVHSLDTIFIHSGAWEGQVPFTLLVTGGYDLAVVWKLGTYCSDVKDDMTLER